ncbi:hypothetical protein LA635_0075 [Erwinia amylovora LA635]|nr:hypothetical protein LA635_0075 [Erwinia amylovora LA635]CDK17067.1 hypothetical protein LA636_0074 [Erwinia amylovora LA636]CDK20436.1 hypothetical protein LA637_0075 [Erwinia amylovora LA637]
MALYTVLLQGYPLNLRDDSQSWQGTKLTTWLAVVK